MRPLLAKDLRWTQTGDLVVGQFGDLDDTKMHPLLSLIQEIKTRISSELYDWLVHPHLGASLQDLLGKPNNAQSAELGRVRIITSLTRDNFLESSMITVLYAPVDKNTLMYRVNVQLPDLTSQESIQVNFLLGLDEFKITFTAVPTGTTTLTALESASTPTYTTAPRLLTAEQVGVSLVKLTFDMPMIVDYAYTSTGNYSITGPTTITVSNITVYSDTAVLVSTNEEFYDGGTYLVEVISVKSSFGTKIDLNYNSASFIGDGTPPYLFAWIAEDGQTFLLTFSEDMANDSTLIDPSNYIIEEV